MHEAMIGQYDENGDPVDEFGKDRRNILQKIIHILHSLLLKNQFQNQVKL